MVERMAGVRRNVGMIALLAALASAAGAHAQSAAAQPPQAASAPDIQALVRHLDLAREHYTNRRLSEAQRELSDAADVLRTIRAPADTQPPARPGKQLPRGGRDVPMPGVLKRVEPEYPLEAAKQGVTGSIVIDVVIGKDGKVRDPRVARSVPALDQAALAAVRQWQFAKPRVGGSPAEISATLVLAFSLRHVPPPTDDIDLARFHVERGDDTAARIALDRVLETVTAEFEDCLAARPKDAAAPVRATGAGGTIKPPTKLRDVRPVYPVAAQYARVSGMVVLEGTIGADGRLRCIRVLRSIPMLDQAAIDAVRQWEFTPTLMGGVPVPVIMTTTVNFTLQ
jgi:protein TonB